MSTDPRELLSQMDAAAPAANGRDPLETSGLAALTAGCDLGDVAVALRKLAPLLPVDALDRRVIRDRAIAALKELRVIDAAGLVDAALPPGAATAGDGLQGQGVTLADPKPWPDPVDGAALLDELAATFARFVALPEAGAVVLALWTLHAHAHGAALISALLALVSPERRCGKTTTLHVLSALLPRSLPASSISSSALFRAVEKYSPALLLDEADSVFGPKGNDDLRCILNASHTRAGAVVIRSVGDDFEPRTFSTWCPKAVAMIGELPGTLADRSLVLRMRRRRPDERVAKLRLDRLAALEPVRQRAWRWGQDHLAELKAMDPLVPDELHDRAADNWRPLLAIADLCGGSWPDRAREAAQIVAGVTTDGDGAPGVQMLSDIRELFTARRVDRLSSADVVDALVQREDRPWPEWKHGRPLTVRQLAKLLARFGVAPTQLRIGEQKVRGYDVAAFADPFARYLPSDPVQAVQPNNDAERSTLGDPVQGDLVPDGEGPGKPGGVWIVPDVPDGEGDTEEEPDPDTFAMRDGI